MEEISIFPDPQYKVELTKMMVTTEAFLHLMTIKLLIRTSMALKYCTQIINVLSNMGGWQMLLRSFSQWQCSIIVLTSNNVINVSIEQERG